MHLKFLDAVRKPIIIRYPNKTDFEVGIDTSIHLTCESDGNPTPQYSWYKDNSTELVSSYQNFTITDMNTTNSGTYTCYVNNTFNGNTHHSTANIQIKIRREGKFNY